jgi:Helix-turn-helix domain
MRDGATEFPEREHLPLLGVTEVAELLGVDRTTIGRWRRAGTFPPHLPSTEEGADASTPTLRAGPLWMRNDIVSDRIYRDRMACVAKDEARLRAMAAEARR